MAEPTYEYIIAGPGHAFPNEKVDPSRLAQEIRGSVIVTALDSILTGGDVCYITFKANLSAGDKTVLDGIVAVHSGAPLEPKLPVQPIRQVDTSSLDPDQAHTRLKGYSFEAVGKDQGTNGKWTSFDFAIPYNIDLLMGEGPAPSEGHEGDLFEFHVAPDTVIGVMAADALEGAETAFVDATSIANLKPGFFVAFGPLADLHEVVNVNYETGQISFEPPLEAAKSAGTYVLRSIVYCQTIHITPSEALSLGGQTAGSTPVPAGTGMRVRYWNTSESAVTVQFRLIYKY